MEEETLVFLDEGFLDKLTKFLDGGKRLKFDKFKFAENIAKKSNLFCKHLFYYTSPPFQSSPPTYEQIIRKRGYDNFINALSGDKRITIRQGRCQRIINDKGEIEYHQKGVDILLSIDLGHINEDFPEIKKIILVSSDTDFCPIIKDIGGRNNIEVILYSYFDRKRNSKFSLSNELIKCCSEYRKLSKEDFIISQLNRKPN
ncbi:NYN domain-containing protein [Candidatus Pacearchaeota archaeon]|nr:NYN domain-containing protein [Candidatus Pacearchaeota archaeon]